MKKTVVSILLAFLILSTTACNNIKTASGSSEESSLKHDETTLESGDSIAEELAENKNDFVTAQYEIGDIILADGSMVKESDLTTVDSSNVPIAVIAGFKEDGTAFGVGVHKSDEPLQWVSDDYAWFVHYFNGYAGECPKNFANVHALAVRAF